MGISKYSDLKRPQRDKEIYLLRKKGWTLKHIGVLYDVSKDRVRQICNRQQREEKAILCRVLTRFQLICEQLRRNS